MNKALEMPTMLPAHSLDSYLTAVNRIPVLSAEEEQELATRLANERDVEAARLLVIAHLRFVVHVARGYLGYGLPLADLVQEGNVGLMKAVKRFDPNHKVRLISFAVHWIRAEIHEYVLRNWRIVKVATTKAQRKLFFNLRSAKKRLAWLNHDEVKAVARDLGVEPKDVLEMESRLSGKDIGFDLPNEADEERVVAPVQYLEDHSQDPARLVEQSDLQENHLEQLSSALEGLDDRSRDIIQRRWVNEPKATLQELADVYGVSVERIRQIEASAMKKLKGAMLAA